LECDVTVLSDQLEGEIYHTVMRLDFKNNQYDEAVSSTNMSAASRTNKNISCDLEVRSEIFFELFPFHIIFKKSMEIISVGDGLSLIMKNIEGELVRDLFNINRPMISLTYDNVNKII
jgi:guanylate cyclase